MSDQEKLTKSIEKASTILVVQAENPDGDSLASSLALEGFTDLMKLLLPVVKAVGRSI